MAKLKLQAKVLHMPGSWGAVVPVQGATVEIIDIDQPGKGDDTIWTGTTNVIGYFQGTSNEWQDSTTIRVWIPDWRGGHWENRTGIDLTDVLLLQAHITQGARETRVPFTYINDNVVSPPLIVPWGPALRVIGKVNSVECTSVTAMTDKINGAVQTNTSPIIIEVYGPDATALNLLRQSRDLLRMWVRQRLNLTVGTYNP